MTTAQEHVWTNADIETLLSGFKASLEMMDGYYSTSEAGVELRDLYNSFNQRREDLKPVVVSTLHNAKCKICHKEFIRSGHGKLLSAIEQNGAVMSHIMNVHKIHDYATRKKNLQKASVTLVTYANRNDCNRGIVQSERKDKKQSTFLSK